MKKFLWSREGAVLSLLSLLVTLNLPADAVPAYSNSNYNTLDYSQDYYHQPTTPPTTTQAPRRASNGNNGGRRTLQSVVRHHMDELDKQTQSDLKILSYLETELNQIFSCYIRLSCPRTRSAKVLAECDEIKDWPLYHQVMKMAGIRRYPYQNYAPQSRQVPSTTTTTSSPPVLDHSYVRSGRHERVSQLLPSTIITTENFNSARDADDDEEEMYYQRDSRHRPRRIRYGQKHRQSPAENEIGDEE
jgi:hypothetical protein